MPSTYAHYRFGQEVRRMLSERDRKIVEEHLDLFLIGLHGPDILFYYKPLHPNPVNQIGYGMHAHPAKEFFLYATRIVEQQKELQKERQKEQQTEQQNGQHNEKRTDDGYVDYQASLAYLYGFICHFALDVSCNGYIDEKISQSGVTHAEIEVEFDRALLIQDGFDPIRKRLTDHITITPEYASVISKFFPGVNSIQVEKALHSMVFYNNLLIAPSKVKRGLVHSLLKVSGNYHEMHGLLVNYDKNPACEDSNQRLQQLYLDGEKLAIMLINEYRAYRHGAVNLNEIYCYTFGSQLIEREVVA